jgi:hypothetical protein
VTAVLLSPHNDDETLFAAFTIMRERPKVIVVLESHLQEQRGNTYWCDGAERLITNAVRQRETEFAIYALRGPDPDQRNRILAAHDIEFWPFRDDRPDWGAVGVALASLVLNPAECVERIYAPALHPRGHEHHNALAQAVNHARAARADLEVVSYCSYERGAPDVRVPGREVKPEPWMVARKLQALACYRSQIELWPHHFLDDQREWYA